MCLILLLTLNTYFPRGKHSADVLFRGASHIDFRTQCVIMTLAGGGTVTNDVLKFRKVIEFESSCIVICFSYIYPIADGKRTFIS